MKKLLIVAAALLAVSLLDAPRAWAGPELPKEIEENQGGVDKVHFWGYGELHYEGERGPGAIKRIDLHRFVIGMGYDFSDKIILRSEIDAEHAFKDPELEFAYLDFLISPALNVRAGSLLMPVGHINENHEPPTFNGVERPELYVNIIPSSWQEGGAGIHGEVADGLHYQLYLVQGLNGAGAGGKNFTAGSGIRNGRGEVDEAAARDMAGVTRLVFTGLPDLRLAASGYTGNSSQGKITKGAQVTIAESDAKYSFAGFDFEGLATLIKIGDAATLNAANGFVGTASIGSTLAGAYGEMGYHLLHLVAPSTEQDVVLFGRYEWYDTQYRVPSGFAADGDNRRSNIWLGATYRPIPQVAVKGNYIFRDDNKGGRADKIELGVGYYF